MSLIYLSSKNCRIETNLDIPIHLKDGEDHYMTLLNLNYSNVFSNTSTPNRTFSITWQYTDSTPEETVQTDLPQNKVMDLEDIYSWASKQTIPPNGSEPVVKFVIDSSDGKGHMVAVDDIDTILGALNISGFMLNQYAPAGSSFFGSIFYHRDISYGYTVGSGWDNIPEQLYTDKEPSISTFNQLFLITPLVENTGRTVVNGTCLAVPMLTAISAAAEPFEYVQYTAFQPMKCRINTNNITNIQFTLLTENNTIPEIVNGADVELSVLVKIE